MSVHKFYENVNRGKEGRNIGIHTGLPKLDSLIYGVQRKTLYTIGADSGGGKTSFALDVFIYNVMKNRRDTAVDILFYAFEMDTTAIYAKLLSLYIWDTYHKSLPYKVILSLESPISEEDYQYVIKSSDWLLELQKHLTIYDKPLNPSGIYATCKNWLKQLGTFIQVDEHREEYINNDPNQYKIVFLDHVGLISGSDTKKIKIDTVVDYMITFRNKCDITGVFIQQLNRNAKSMDRKTNGYELIGLDDFKDTSGTTDGSEVVIALYFPYREKIAKCENYPIQNVLKKRFRLCQLLKGRYGDADINIGLNFHGEIGLFKELPRPEEIGDYAPYLELDYKEEKQIDNKENQFMII